MLHCKQHEFCFLSIDKIGTNKKVVFKDKLIMMMAFQFKSQCLIIICPYHTQKDAETVYEDINCLVDSDFTQFAIVIQSGLLMHV